MARISKTGKRLGRPPREFPKLSKKEIKKADVDGTLQEKIGLKKGIKQKRIVFPTLPPRDYQLDFWKAMDNGARRVILSYPRRGGKDITSAMYLARQALAVPGTYWILAPTKMWASRIYWEGISEIKYHDPITGRIKKVKGSILDIAIPHDVRMKTNQVDSKIYLPNGSTIMLGGTDEETFVGQTGKGFVITEYSLHKDGILPLINPIITESDGWLIINGTQRSPDNQLNQLIEETVGNPQWYTTWQTPEDTKQYYWISKPDINGKSEININPELKGQKNEWGTPYPNIQDLVDVEPHKKVLYMREYLNMALSMEEGSYYEEQLRLSYDRQHINDEVYHDVTKPVYTVWDLGIRDTCAIIFFQMDNDMKIPTVIDYYENSGLGIEHYINEINSKCYTYGNHYVSQRTLQTGTDLIEHSRNQHQFIMTKLLKSKSVKSDIELVRSIIPMMKFNKEKTTTMIKHLWKYHQSPTTGKPVHDDSSNCADALRYLCLAIDRRIISNTLITRHLDMDSHVINGGIYDTSLLGSYTSEGLPESCE